jgi:uncharacterized protein YbjT (DUF2867 family)
MFVVAGVTGRTGMLVAKTLVQAGKKVRGLVPEGVPAFAWQEEGLEVRQISTLADESALAVALEGAEAAYFLLPTDVRARDFLAEGRRMEEAIAGAVERARVPHVLHLSSIGAHQRDGTGPIRALHYAEECLAKTSAKVTILRAALFLENWGAFAQATKVGKLPTFVPTDLVYPTVATEDIGRTAARALLEGPRISTPDVIELSGPRDLSARDLALVFGSLLKRVVEAEQVPLDGLIPTFMKLGFSQGMSELYQELYAGLASGIVTWEGTNTRSMRGTVEAREVLSKFV